MTVISGFSQHSNASAFPQSIVPPQINSANGNTSSSSLSMSGLPSEPSLPPLRLNAKGVFKIVTMEDLKCFIQHYCAMQGASSVFIGPSEASKGMSLASTESLVNYLRLPKCMERKSEEQWKDSNERKAQGKVPQGQMETVVLYRFDADVLAMKTSVYVKRVLGYICECEHAVLRLAE